MSLDATEVRVAGAGHVYIAVAGTELPTDLEAMPEAWTDLGYVTTDGVGFTMGREVENIDGWQGSKLRVVITNDPVSVNFALMQSNKDVLPVAFGGGEITSEGGGVFIYHPPAKGENAEHTLVIEFEDGDISYRYCLARVQLEDNVEFTLTRSGAVTYPIPFGVLDNGDEDKWFIVSNDEALGS